MKIRSELLEELNHTSNADEVWPETITKYLKKDINTSYDMVVGAILHHKLKVSTGWQHYVLNDIDTYYTDDALILYDRAQMLDVFDYMDDIDVGDSALIIVYEYIFPDMYNSPIFMAKLIHVLHRKAKTNKLSNVYVFRSE